jgi:hypothetical protein
MASVYGLLDVALIVQRRSGVCNDLSRRNLELLA